MSNILDTVVELNEIDSKAIKIIMGEVGSGKTTFLKDMPDVAGGDILYIPIGNDKGFNQLKSDSRFKTFPQPIKTIYVERKGHRVAIKKRVLPQLIEILEAFKEDPKNFRGFTIDAISSIQEAIESEIKFETEKNLQFDDWSAIKKAMFRIYELSEEIAGEGYEVALQSHFQIREYTDNYTGETMSRTLPMMTENNAVRVLKNADAVVFIKVMSDAKNPTIVHRMTVLGGHPTIPTKLRNEHNLSFDGILFQNLTYAGLTKLMQIDSIEGIEGTEDLENVIIKKAVKKKGKIVKKKADKEETEEVETKRPVKKSPAKKIVEESEDEDDEIEEAPKKRPAKRKVKKIVKEEVEEDEEVVKPKRKPARKIKPVVEEDEEDDEIVEAPKKKPAKRTPPKVRKIVEEDDEDEVTPPKKSPTKKKVVEEDILEDDDDLEEDELFEEDE